MNFTINVFVFGLILSSNFVQIRCQDFLNCSAYSLNTTNATIKRLGWSARVHACFQDNPYDLTQPPVPFGYPPITILYDYNVINVNRFEGGAISIMGHMVLIWQDFYRTWDINQIPLEQIQIPISEIWYPQVTFISSITKRSLKLLQPDDQAIIFPEYVSILRPNVLEGHCNVNYFRFPFDEQNCLVQFEFERYFITEHDVYLSRMNYTYQFDKFINGEWSLVNVVSVPTNVSFKETEVDLNGYSTNVVSAEMYNAKIGFQVILTIHRHPQFYVFNIIVPIAVLTVIGQTAFAIPEHAEGRLGVPLSVLLGFMFVQGIVSKEVPRSQVAPSLSNYVLACVVLSFANVLCSAFCLWIAKLTHSTPRWLHTAVVVVIGTCVFPSKWFLLIYHYCRRHKGSISQHKSGKVEVLPIISIVPTSLPEENFSIPRAHLEGGQNSNGLHQLPSQLLAKSAERLNAMIANQKAIVDAGNVNNNEWIHVAKVVNRIFGLLHIAALLTCFFVFVFPILIGYNNYN